MASKKKELKKSSKKSKRDKRKDKKGSGKLPKKSPKVAKLKAPAKKEPGKKPKKAKAKADGYVPVGEVDFSAVMVDEVFRRRVCRELNLTSREAGYVSRAIGSVARTAHGVQQDAIGNSDHPLVRAQIAPLRTVDLASLELVVNDQDVQRDIRHSQKRSSFMGPKSVKLLWHFVAKAKKLALADLSTAG